MKAVERRESPSQMSLRIHLSEWVRAGGAQTWNHNEKPVSWWQMLLVRRGVLTCPGRLVMPR